MALEFIADNPVCLLEVFRANIDNGTITAWRYNAQGQFTLTASRWTRQAWLTPIIEPDRLRFYMVPVGQHQISRLVFVYYQAHMLETFMLYLFHLYEQSGATSSAVSFELAA
jgi:hypothetical protein